MSYDSLDTSVDLITAPRRIKSNYKNANCLSYVTNKSVRQTTALTSWLEQSRGMSDAFTSTSTATACTSAVSNSTISTNTASTSAVSIASNPSPSDTYSGSKLIFSVKWINDYWNYFWLRNQNILNQTWLRSRDLLLGTSRRYINIADEQMSCILMIIVLLGHKPAVDVIQRALDPPPVFPAPYLTAQYPWPLRNYWQRGVSFPAHQKHTHVCGCLITALIRYRIVVNATFRTCKKNLPSVFN